MSIDVVRATGNTGVLLSTTNLTLDITQPYTVMFWLKPVTALSQYYRAYRFDTDSSNYDMFETDGNMTTLNARSVVGGSSDQTFQASLVVGTWTHIAFVAEAANIKIMQDGTNVQTKVRTLDETSRAAATLFQLGREGLSGGERGFSYFAMKVYQRAMTAAEVFEESNCVYPKSTANLINWHPLWGTADAKDYYGTMDLTVGSACLDGTDNPAIAYSSGQERYVVTSSGAPAARRIFLIS